MENTQETLNDTLEWAVRKVRDSSYNFEECATRVSKKKPKEIFSEDVVAAIWYTGGVYEEAAQLLGITRQRLRNFINDNIEVYDFCRERVNDIADRVERVLVNSALDGESWAIQFFLRSKAPDRGYSPRMNMNVGDAPSIKVEFVPTASEETKR